MVSLTSQTVLITGCSSGIGRELAIEFARQGHQVFASARRLESIQDLKQQGIETLTLDVTDPVAITSAVSRMLESVGRIDMLFNNAGYVLVGPMAEVPLEDVRRQFETNTVGPIALVQAVIPHMVKRRAGRIVNVGSPSSILVTPFGGVYSGSKAALHCMSEALRVEVAPLGIEVILVYPGAVQSSLGTNAEHGLERYRQEHSLYRSLVHSIERRAYLTQTHPMATEVFAQKVVTAVTRRKAPLVVRVGKGSWWFPAIKRLLPDAVIDKLVSRRFELEKLDA